MRRLLFAALLPTTAIAPSALAQTTAERVVVPRKTVLDFTEIAISATVSRPDVVYVQSVRRARFRSLVRTRGSFVPELERTVDDL